MTPAADQCAETTERHACSREVLDLDAIISESLTFKCPGPSLRGGGRPRPLAALPCFVALGIDRLSPAAIFLPLIEPPPSCRRLLRKLQSMAPRSLASVPAPPSPRGCSRESRLRRVVWFKVVARYVDAEARRFDACCPGADESPTA